MPSEPTAEQLELRRKGRQRLIGAVALALLAVVFVPMLLDPEPRRERAEPLLAIPPRDGAPPLPAAPKLPEASAEAGKVAEAAKVAPADAPVVLPVPVTPEQPATGADRAPAGESRKTVEPKAAEFKKAAPKAAPAKVEPAKAEPAKADPAKTEAPRLEGYAVQVGAFKDEAKLKLAREKLTTAGISHFIDRQPDFTRLRAGPFPTREAAESALPAVKRAGLDGRVVPLP
jgi:DedD protein